VGGAFAVIPIGGCSARKSCGARARFTLAFDNRLLYRSLHPSALVARQTDDPHPAVPSLWRATGAGLSCCAPTAARSPRRPRQDQTTRSTYRFPSQPRDVGGPQPAAVRQLRMWGVAVARLSSATNPVRAGVSRLNGVTGPDTPGRVAWREGPAVTEMIEPMPAQIDQQQLAQELVDRASNPSGPTSSTPSSRRV
jgi:hypothetical protein